MKRYLAVAPLMIALMIGCAASSRQRVVSAGDVDTGPGSLTEARQRLQGRWQLISLNIAADDGRKADIEASGALALDGFGGLTIEFTMTPAGQKALSTLGITSPNPKIATSGQVAINPQQREVTYVGDKFTSSGGMNATVAANRANPFALERIRYYTFEPDGSLTLATRYDSGRDAVVSKWKKAG